MRYPKHKIGPGWRYEEAQHAALALEELLHRHGITIDPGSAFESHVLRVMKLTYDKKAGIAADDPNLRETYRTFAGVYELAKHILEVKESPSFSGLLPHLRMLNDGASLQNVRSVLDDPYSPAGDNPDVLATFGARRWGIACKVLHGIHPEGFISNLAKGLDQIDNSPADIGVVLFNLKNVLPHDAIWPLGPIPVPLLRWVLPPGQIPPNHFTSCSIVSTASATRWSPTFLQITWIDSSADVRLFPASLSGPIRYRRS